MSKVAHLSLVDPVSIVGESNEVWIADGATRMVTLFDAVSANPLSHITLDAAPACLALVDDFLTVGLINGSIVWYDRYTGQEALRRAVGPGKMRLEAASGLVWVLAHDAAALVAFDIAGNRRSVTVDGVSAFAAGANGVYWISDEKMICFDDGLTSSWPPMGLSVGQEPHGALVVCANALWVSVTAGLQMVSLQSLESGSTLPAPEGPVDHLICDADHRIFGGLHGLFVLDPAADANIRPLDVTFKSSLRGLTAAGDYIWALESLRPTAHILKIP